MHYMRFILLLTWISIVVSCSKSNDNSPSPGTVHNSDTIDVRGVIKTDQHWVSAKTYRLRGYVYVDSPAVLTIDAGTRIISNKDSAGVLVIYKGAKLMAKGTATQPIVFTSAETNPKPGDLGGLILVGKAIGNGNHAVLEGGVDDNHKLFGGNNDADNSGVLEYIRIEYGGKAVNPGDEINGLSLYTVGSGTTIDHIEVIRGLDDAYEFFGGSVNAKYLIAYNCADDDYDMDDGYHGMIQFAISVKDPDFTDNKGTTGDISNNFEVDNTNGKKDYVTTTPITYPILSNFTAVGPNNASGTSPNYGYGMRWRRGAKFILANSIVIGGQKAGLDLDDDPTAQYYRDSISRFWHSFLHAVQHPFQVDKIVNSPAPLDSAGLRNLVLQRDSSIYFANPADIGLNDPFNNVTPNLSPKSGSPALSYPTVFTGKLSNSFFTKVNYIGAIDPNNDWTKEGNWVVWNK